MEIYHTVQKTAVATMFVFSASGASIPTNISTNTNNIIRYDVPTQAPTRLVEEKILSSGKTIKFLTTHNENTLLSEKKIVSLINGIFHRETKYRIDYDNELDLYFFRVMSNEDLFEEDFDRLAVADSMFAKELYQNKTFIVTLEASNV